MSLVSVLEALEASPFPKAIAESGWMFPTIESLHVVALALVVGSIMIVDLRLLGLTRRNIDVVQVADETLPWTWTAFVAAALTGALMFSSRATDYWGNNFFRIKLVLLALAGLNMVAFHLLTWRNVENWRGGVTPPAARLAALLSLLLWVAIVVCGRWIGFT